MDNTGPWTVIDLFSGLGGFSAAFADSDDWRVVMVDLDPDGRFAPDIQADVMDLRPIDLPGADVVLAAVPCVDLTMACFDQKWDAQDGRHPKYIPKVSSVAGTVALLYHTLWLIGQLKPDYWYLENPATGMMQHLIGSPQGVVHYCQYGKDYKKPTGLWGVHAPMHYRRCPGRRQCGHTHNPDGDHDGPGNFEVAGTDPAERAKVPYDLSLAIREAVEDAYANPPPEQATLTETAP